MRESTCKACLAAIVWIKTPSGKSMPCDAAPVYYIAKPRAGTKKIVKPNGETISCELTDDPHKATGTGFVPHWSTCPNASQFKKAGPPRGRCFEIGRAYTDLRLDETW